MSLETGPHSRIEKRMVQYPEPFMVQYCIYIMARLALFLFRLAFSLTITNIEIRNYNNDNNNGAKKEQSHWESSGIFILHKNVFIF